MKIVSKKQLNNILFLDLGLRINVFNKCITIYELEL